jgi:hypothetical protein
VSQKEAWNHAVEDDYFDVLVRFDRRNDLILRTSPTEDASGGMIGLLKRQ